MKKLGPESIQRAARLYASNKDASLALGIALHTFGRLCRRFGIETPYARRARQRQRAGKAAYSPRRAAKKSPDDPQVRKDADHA